ncbi:LysM peptidoglycan-binding domain-containing protein [Patescibacteria group bacterium]|nr:LysM peptidoglycan-binding domain-containing protein [Patescibacteria group bacterium]MBU1954055.1 LysM peptidoglycan-binding domain-containing protein [Patescibacteria group bacterium]
MAIIGLALLAAPVSAALAEFSVVPATPNERQFNFTIPAGQSLDESIIVNNLGNNAITVDVYGADGTNSSQGTFSLTSKSHEQKHIGTWVRFENPTVTIPAKQAITIPFTISVPDNATPGNYGGGVAVQASSAELKGEEEAIGPGAVSTSARIYIRTFVKIPGEKISNYQWTAFGFNHQDESNKPRFFFSFKNNGNTIILVQPEITLKGLPPLKESTLTMSEMTLQPGTSLDNIELRWDEQPPVGFYFVDAKVDFSELDITNDQRINEETQTRSIRINLTPTYIIVLTVVIILAAILFCVFATLSIVKMRSGCCEHKVLPGETITSIAKKHNVNWKKLAQINKLKSPYTLKEGRILFVPPINPPSKK